MEFERACKTDYKSTPTVTPGIQRTITLSELKIADYNTQKENPIRKKIHLLRWLQHPEWEHNQEKNSITSPIIARKPHYCFKPQHKINCFQVIVLLEKVLQIWNMISIVVAHLSRKRVDSIATNSWLHILHNPGTCRSFHSSPCMISTMNMTDTLICCFHLPNLWWKTANLRTWCTWIDGS